MNNVKKAKELEEVVNYFKNAKRIEGVFGGELNLSKNSLSKIKRRGTMFYLEGLILKDLVGNYATILESNLTPEQQEIKQIHKDFLNDVNDIIDEQDSGLKIVVKDIIGLLDNETEKYYKGFAWKENESKERAIVQNGNDGLHYQIDTPSYYDNSKGSLYKIAIERGWDAYQFDIIKRIDRAYKKGQFKEDCKKTKDLIDLMILENNNK